MDGFWFSHLSTDIWNFYEFTNFMALKKELLVSYSRITSSMLRQKISLDHLRKTAQITSYKEKHHIPFTFTRSTGIDQVSIPFGWIETTKLTIKISRSWNCPPVQDRESIIGHETIMFMNRWSRMLDQTTEKRFPMNLYWMMLNRCILRRSSRDLRNVRSYCPRAAAPDPSLESGTPACGLDQPANIGISPWTARFDNAKVSPADNCSARFASLLVPSCPGTVSNLR